MTPASNAAQNGCTNTFALFCATVRRRMAPIAALTKMSAAAGRCRTPKINANATAPAAAASVNSHVGVGGAREIALIASFAAAGERRPSPSSSVVRMVEATRFISTPVGSAATAKISLASLS
jgi:hypothetical protein